MSQPQQSKICQIADQFDQFSWMPSRFFALTGQPVGQYYRPLPKIRGVTKKQHSKTNEVWNEDQVGPTMFGGPDLRFDSQNAVLTECCFFCDTVFH